MEIVCSFIFRGVKRDTALSIAGIIRHQYYSKPKSGRRGKPPSQETLRINGEDVDRVPTVVPCYDKFKMKISCIFDRS